MLNGTEHDHNSKVVWHICWTGLGRDWLIWWLFCRFLFGIKRPAIEQMGLFYGIIMLFAYRWINDITYHTFGLIIVIMVICVLNLIKRHSGHGCDCGQMYKIWSKDLIIFCVTSESHGLRFHIMLSITETKRCTLGSYGVGSRFNSSFSFSFGLLCCWNYPSIFPTILGVPEV